MKAQLLSLFLLAAPLVLNVVNSEATSEEPASRAVEARGAECESHRDQARESKDDRGGAARPAERHATTKPASKPAKKSRAGHDYWFM